MSGEHNLSDSDESFGYTLPARGSLVCLRNRTAQRSLSLDTCHIGRIVKYSEIDSKPYCIVELYLRPETLPCNTDKQGYKLKKLKEVVADCHQNLGQFPALDIICRCMIIGEDSLHGIDTDLNRDDPTFLLRFKLEETEPKKFIIKPLDSSLDKMVSGKSEILSEKGLNSEEERYLSCGPRGLKSPRQVVENPAISREDVKENLESNVSSRKARSPSFNERPSKSSVRRSLVSDLDCTPAKQSRVYDDKIVSACEVKLEKIDSESDADSIWKDSWVSQLMDSNIPIVDNGRCPTPIRLSLKRIRSDITPSKLGDNSRLRRKSTRNDNNDVSESDDDYSQQSVNRASTSAAVTSSRRSARKTKCAISLAESTTDSDPEDDAAAKTRSGRKIVNKTCGESSNSRTPKGKAAEPTGRRSTRRQSTWEAEQPKTPSCNKSTELQTTAEVEPKGEVIDLLSPLESGTPLSKRKPRKTPQPQENTTEEPKTPRSRNAGIQTASGMKSSSVGEVVDVPTSIQSTTPLPKRKRGKSVKQQDDTDESNMSSVESKTPIKILKVDEGQRTPRTSSKTSSKSPRTPKAKTPLKTPSRSALTPSMPARVTARFTPTSSLEQIRKNLHVSAVPMSLPCRESEYRNIYNFLENKIRDSAGGCMYISGVPGTGKTATVTAVVRSLKKLADSKKLKDFQYIETNGLRMTEPRQVFVQVLKALTGQKCTPQQAQDILAERFCSGSAKNKTVVLLVDEVDMLRNRRQDVIYNLFDWPSKPNSRFIVLTIANTMDLPERLLKGRVTSRLGLTRLTFQPYSYKQLQEIVLSRLQGSNSFNDDAVELVARKVAACSGDVRRALDICRRASEMVEEGNPVTMPIVNQVLSQMMNSANVCSIKACSRLEKLFLQAIVAENERTGVEETNFISVYRQFQSFCALSSVTLINISEAMALLNRLGTSGLLLTEHSRADINQSIFLNVNADDIHYALNQVAPAS
ncbi:origin recognition complex subunit 1 isoform X2 [Thrips palmi]|uniref:Origin recognition complex subunit 1 n=1 Tax=Thrips palmi TaxID=161013 RepID=A0A6P8YUN4_THRPL|nr:origin recognition complex subunit 1 isoform X2 [Thrips palmi]